MKEYIEKDLVMDALLHEQYGYCCENAINKIPADVVEVQQGGGKVLEWATITVRFANSWWVSAQTTAPTAAPRWTEVRDADQ